MGKGKEAADRGTMSGKHQLPLAQSSSVPAELPEDSKAEAPSPSVTEGDRALLALAKWAHKFPDKHAPCPRGQ